MINSKTGQRVVGMISTGLMGGVLVVVWEHALAGKSFNRWAACVGPALFVFGLAFLLAPLDIRAHQKKWGTERPRRFREFPLLWRVLFFLALAAGFVNWIALSQLTR